MSERVIARVIARGLGAIRIMRQLLPTMSPVRGSTSIIRDYIIPLGSIDRHSGLVIVGSSGTEVVYLERQELKAMAVNQFLHMDQINQIAGEVTEATRFIEPLGRAGFALVLGMVSGGIGGWIVLGATAATSVAKVAIFYENNSPQVDMAMRYLDEIGVILTWFQRNCPVACSKLASLAGDGLWVALRSVPQGVMAADTATVFGRVIGALGNPANAGARGLLSVFSGAIMVVSSRLPGIMARGSMTRAQAAGTSYIDTLDENLIPVSAGERAAIIAEFQRHPEVATKLEELGGKLQSALPVISGLVQAFSITSLPTTMRNP